MKEEKQVEEKSHLPNSESKRNNHTTVFRKTIEKVRTSNDIISIVGKHVKLQRSGKNYFGFTEEFLKEYGFGSAPSCDYSNELVQFTEARRKRL